jgi:uncharacterized membrane protein YeaQ/YmgE (transglycosylase-associated protein family)
MKYVWLVIVGVVVGAIARFLMPGAQPMGWIMTSLLGIGGSIVGGLLAEVIWRQPDGKFTPAGWILSIIGAMVLLWVAPMVIK